MPKDPNTAWKLTGIVATFVIVATIPLAYWKHHIMVPEPEMTSAANASVFVGSQACRDCHKKQYDQWAGSHHRWAMEAATEKTVLGNFDNAEFTHFGQISRFYRRNGKFYVHTQGVGGQSAEFEISHTFGWHPLQQYLVPFPGGRLQCLPIAWDVKKKRWYHLYPDAPLDPQDWLYWTNNGQNWNGMCAECHSTDLKKQYNYQSDTYATTWSEISVGCEACHGPGDGHVKWAQLPEMGRPEVENYALTVKTRGQTSRQQIELCAPCHSRRMSLDDNMHQHADFLDYGIPQLLTDGLYFVDGQILDEVYVYGSFMQSKMYARDVRCSDCHDVHSIRRIKKGNDLCLQCHKAAIYDRKEHHFHKKDGQTGQPIRAASGEILFEVGSGARCEGCHMPGRHYMGIDYRPDHSFRLPRPDLTLAMGTPNACDRCHVDKSTQWSVDAMTKWYGEQQRPHYGQVLHAGRERRPEAPELLASLTRDRLYPTIVRATALAQLADYGPSTAAQAFASAMNDEASLMRQTAVRHLPETDSSKRLKTLTPMLYDPVRAVRIEAAAALARMGRDKMPADAQQPFDTALAEYRQAMQRTADFSASRHNLGNLYANLNQPNEAEKHYRQAIKIDGQFYPAKVNLAMLYNQSGKKGDAEQLLREVIDDHPDLFEIKYSLGLLLAEQNRLQEAVVLLGDASAGLPQRSRIHYNLGLMLQKVRRDNEAETALLKALAVEPDSPDYLYALALFYMQRARWDQARKMAARMVAAHPDIPAGRRLLNAIDTNTDQAKIKR